VIGPKRGMTTRDLFSQTWNTNVTGTHILTTTFVPLLLKSTSPRLLFLTSGTASFKLTLDPDFILNKAPPAGWPKPVQRELPAYKASKVGVNMLMRDWERVLRKDGVKVWTVNPGFLVTGLGGDPSVTKKMGAGDARLGGEIVRDVVEGKRDEDVGKTVQANGILAW
jgi:NAD(P)-dependent dehydrogenase (short-subunit alcohol dehydrogenase family)